jgi:hypothetical protein
MRLLKWLDRLTNNAMDEWTADQMEHYKRTGKWPPRKKITR